MQDWEQQRAAVQVSDAILDKRRKDLVNEAAGDDELDPDSLQERIDELRAGLGRARADAAAAAADRGRHPGGARRPARRPRPHHRRLRRGRRPVREPRRPLRARLDLLGHLQQGHCGADLVVDRKSSGAVIVYDPALTLVIATQPEMLRTIAGKPGAAGRGVLARPAVRAARPGLPRRAHPEADPAVLDEYERRVRAVYEDTPELGVDDDDHPRPALLTFTAAARTVFERSSASCSRSGASSARDGIDGDALYLGWLSKLAGQTARLAAVLHVAANWTGGYGASLLAIDDATVERAVALARYYRAHALRVFGLMGELPEQRRAVAILGWLALTRHRTSRELTVREVHRSRGKGTTADQVRVALQLLEEHGYVRVERLPRTGSGGRASERVHVHPQISNLSDTPDRPDTGRPTSGVSGLSEGFPICADHPDAGAWKARDGVWRCHRCEPPAFPGEIVEERAARCRE